MAILNKRQLVDIERICRVALPGRCTAGETARALITVHDRIYGRRGISSRPRRYVRLEWTHIDETEHTPIEPSHDTTIGNALNAVHRGRTRGLEQLALRLLLQPTHCLRRGSDGATTLTLWLGRRSTSKVVAIGT